MSYSTTSQVYYKSGLDSTAVSTTICTQFISWADALIEKRTGKKYSTAATYTEQFDSYKISYHKDVNDEGGMLTGTKPYHAQFNQVSLNNRPVTEITSVRLIQHDSELDKVYSYDSDAGTYTDNTTEANSVRGTPFYAFASSVGTDDSLYVGGTYRFTGITISLSTVGVGGVLTWEYYDGSSWTALSNVTEGTSSADDLNASGEVYWDLPSDWQETTVNSEEKFWIRARVTSAHSTSPKVNHIYYGQNRYIYEELEGYDYQWETNGTVTIKGQYLIDEFQYVQVVYKAGSSTVPSVVEQLSTVLAAISCLTSLMGGSYDDVVSGQKGDEQFNKGEPYTNLRATIIELRKEEQILWGLVGGPKFVIFST